MWFSLLLLVPSVQDTATPDPAAAQAPAVFTPLLHFECNGPEAWLVAEKDRALLAALQMLDERLLELPGEIPDFDAPPGLVPLALRLLGGQTSLTIGTNSEPIPGIPIGPFAAELRLTKSSGEEARALARDVAEFIGQMGAPMTDPGEGNAWVLPAPLPLWLGEADGSVFVRLGLEDGVPSPDLSGLLPAGAQMRAGGMFDYGAFLDLIQGFVGTDDPEFENMLDLLEMMGIDEMSIEFALGSDSERSYAVMNMPGWAANATEAGLLPEGDLNPAIVAAIPADATWASASSFDLGAILGLYREMFKGLSGDADLDIDAIVEEFTGLNLQKDLVDPFGHSAAVYSSDTTGGGGIFSTVLIMELANREAFLATCDKVEQSANAMGQEFAKGYVRISHYKLGGLDMSVLSFPGLPVPFEITMATAQQYVVLGLTPQAVVGAVGQIGLSTESSLLHNPLFKEQLPADMDGVVSVGWLNTPRLMQDGYSAMSLFCSALANGVRSPGNRDREPGMILPPFNELREGAKAMVSVGRKVGGDFRSETRADSSILVNAAGISGYVVNSPILPLVALAMVGGVAAQRSAVADIYAIEAEPRELAPQPEHEHESEDEPEQDAPVPPPAGPSKRDKVDRELTVLLDVVQDYSIRNGGNFPHSLKELVTPDVNGFTYLKQKTVPMDPWGREYLYKAPASGEAPTVFTLGEDGVAGGEGANEDVRQSQFNFKLKIR